MKTLCHFLFLAGLFHQSASAATFAIACEGSSSIEDTADQPTYRSNRQLSTQTYVIDDQAGTVRHALEARQEFEDVCTMTAPDCAVDISKGLIRVSGSKHEDGVTTTTEFEADRATGVTTHTMNLDFASGTYHRLLWSMVCRSSSIPDFGKLKNKF